MATPKTGSMAPKIHATSTVLKDSFSDSFRFIPYSCMMGPRFLIFDYLHFRTGSVDSLRIPDEYFYKL